MREDIPATPKSKICIVGFADGHRDQAPWDSDDMEFWGLNRLHQVLGHRNMKFDRWFELHSLQRFYLDNDDTVHAEFLRDFPGPVYVRADDMGLMDIPNAVPYPIAAVLENFQNYFTNSVSWMIVLAILELADAAQEFKDSQRFGDGSVPPPELHVYGVDMAQDTLMTAEYAEQRPSCEFYLGVAQALGIHLFFPDGSDLLKVTHMYGFDDTDPMRGKHQARIAELNGRQSQMQAQLDQGDGERAKLIAGINQLAGAIQDETYWLRNLMPSEEEGEPVVTPVTLETLAGGLAAVSEQVAALTAPEAADIGDE